MMNDPDQTLYKLYISKELDLEKIDQLNYRFGMDGSQPAPENPEIIERNWVRKKNPDGTVKRPKPEDTVKFLHWNILADKLTQNFDKVPDKYMDWQFRWKMMQQ